MYTMQPNKDFITIHNNKKLINDFLWEVIYSQHIVMNKWSEITNQTPNLKIGYPGQHLASLITGVKGETSVSESSTLNSPVFARLQPEKTD